MSSFTRKQLEARITLAQGTFTAAKDGGTTKIVRLGMAVSISKPGGQEKNKAVVKIYNMPLADMEQLTTLAFRPLSVANNVIAIYAGDDAGLSLAFSGDIISAVPDFNAAPDPVFNISCITGYVATIKAVPPLTRQGQVMAGDVLRELATQMSLAYSGQDDAVPLRNIALEGGPMEQARAVAAAARLELIVDDGEMIVKPVTALREGGDTPVWSDKAGLINYPGFDNAGIVCRGIYEPRLRLGGPLSIRSVVPRASGLWRVTSLTHTLQANYPTASRWESSVKAAWQQEA